jgi:hypothetical protein
MFVNCCHCRWCQRETGAAFAVNALIETDRVVLLKGNVEATETPSHSGKGQRIMRCSVCKIALWSHYGRRGDKLAVLRVGTLDNPDAYPPGVHIWTSSKQPWVILPPGTPDFPEFPDWAELWPAESLARAKALFG